MDRRLSYRRTIRPYFLDETAAFAVSTLSRLKMVQNLQTKTDMHNRFGKPFQSIPPYRFERKPPISQAAPSSALTPLSFR